MENLIISFEQDLEDELKILPYLGFAILLFFLSYFVFK
jgi:hypothetical protein